MSKKFFYKKPVKSSAQFTKIYFTKLYLDSFYVSLSPVFTKKSLNNFKKYTIWSLNINKPQIVPASGKFFKKTSFLMLAIYLLDLSYSKQFNNKSLKLKEISKSLWSLINTYKIIF